MFTPTFSLITVTYNAGAVLEGTIRSILSQTYPHIEYIIVDGASTDDTLAIASRYRDRIATLVSEPDKGLYDAMNKGLRLATGDYVCFVNAGDHLHTPDTLQRIVDSVQSAAGTTPPAAPPDSTTPTDGAEAMPDVLYGETALVDNKGHFVGMRRLSTPERLTWRSFRSGMVVCHQAFFARRTLAQGTPYDTRYRFSADFDWCIRVMQQARRLHNTRLTVVDYLDEGLTTRNHHASLLERFNIMCRHYGTVSTVLHHAWFALRMVTHRKRV